MQYSDSIEKSREMVLVGASSRRWICEIHREIYDVIEKYIPEHEKDAALDLVAEAFWYGKRMSDRLKELNDVDSDLFIPDNFKYWEKLARRAERVNLLRRIHTVNIETLDWCNRKCDWCPNKNRDTSPNNIMPDDVFVRILRQLLEYNFNGEIHPFLNGEPTMDKRLPEKIHSIKSVLPRVKVKVITNGDGLRSANKLDLLFASGCDSIHMNHYDGRFKDIGRALDSKYPGLSHFGLAYLMDSFYNRAGKVEYKPKVQIQDGCCDWFMHKLVFTYKGDLILCCSDFNSEVKFGNIMEQPLSMILESDLCQKYLRAHKDGKGKEMPLCKDCNRLA